ncbi:DUF4931 domain-containing protein [Streptomyces sp. NPDC054770]
MTPRTDPAVAAPGAAHVVDAWTGRQGFLASGRGDRTGHTGADAGCPFCPGGTEHPGHAVAPYAFPNRWPALPGGHCEVVVHDTGHQGDFGTLPARQIRRVIDLWARRSQILAAHPEVACVLVFENRGPEAGATVAHPHSQVFGLPVVPEPLRPPAPAAGCPGCAPADQDLLVRAVPGWHSGVPEAPPAPFTLRIAPERHVATLDELDSAERAALALLLADSVVRLDALFDAPMPYHLWVVQGHGQGRAHLNVVISGLARSATRLRIPGAAEAATGMFFTPQDPVRAATLLRSVGAPR